MKQERVICYCFTLEFIATEKSGEKVVVMIIPHDTGLMNIKGEWDDDDEFCSIAWNKLDEGRERLATAVQWEVENYGIFLMDYIPHDCLNVNFGWGMTVDEAREVAYGNWGIDPDNDLCSDIKVWAGLPRPKH